MRENSPYRKLYTILIIPAIAGFLCFALLFATVSSAATGIYETINFQGKLVNSSGLNVADGNYDIVFRLYDASSGGSTLWTENHTSGNAVAVSDGIFRVNLGSITSLSSVDFNQDNLWLGIKVGADAEMTPRVRFTAAPYAFQAKNVTWSGLTNPAANLSLSHSTYTTSHESAVTSGTFMGITANSLTTGTGLSLSSSSTAGGASGLSKMFNIARSGTNSNASHTAYGLYSTVTNTGTSSTNIAGYFSASGATNNYAAIFENGNVGIGTTSPSYKLDVAGTTNISSGSTYKIAGTDVLSASTLGSGVTASSLTSVGTISSGTWQGTTVGVGYGGTGLTSYTTGDLIYSSATNTLSKLGIGTDGYILTSNGTTPQWESLSSAGVVAGSGTTNRVAYWSDANTVAADEDFFFNGTNVGIGTTAPGARLDIAQGNIDLDNTTYSNQYGILSKNGTTFLHNFNYGNNGTVTTQGRNTFLGENAGNLTMGNTATNAAYASDNTAIGYNSLSANTNGYRNTVIGSYAGTSNTTGNSNTFIGNYGGRNNTTGAQNIFIGLNTGFTNSSGGYNTFLGNSAGYSNDSGSYNVYIGENAAYTATGSTNTVIGRYAGNRLKTGAQNVLMGEQAFRFGAGNSNVVIGLQAGSGGGAAVDFSSANNNTILGFYAGYGITNNSSNNVFLGYQAGYSETGSNKLYIENSSSTSPLIYGDFSSDYVQINSTLRTSNVRAIGASGLNLQDDGGNGIFVQDGGNVGIGTTAPNWQLSLTGSMHSNSVINATNAVSTTTLRTSGGGIGRYENVLLRSEEFDNSYWTKDTVSISQNAVAAPDGTTTADKIVEDNTNAQHRVRRAGGVTLSTSSESTFSIYAKAAERSEILILMLNGGTYARTQVNLNTGALIGTQTGTPQVEKLENGWWRISTTATAPSASGNQPMIYVTSGGSSSYQGDGTSGIYIWGAQIETGSTAGVYAKTEASTITAGRGVYTNLKAYFGGNVGIGTTAPSTLLSLGNTSYTFAASGLSFGDMDTGFYESADDFLHVRTAGSDRVTFDSSGRVGVGITNPSYSIHSTGQIDGDCFSDGGSVVAGSCSSDVRLKKNVNSLNSDSLSKLLKLNPVEFEYNKLTGVRQYGFLAHEVEKIFPEFVSTDSNGYKQVMYGLGFQMHTIRGIQEQQNQLQALNIRLTSQGYVLGATESQLSQKASESEMKAQFSDVQMAIKSLDERVTKLSSDLAMQLLDNKKESEARSQILDDRLSQLESFMATLDPEASGSSRLSGSIFNENSEATMSALLVTGKTNLYDLSVTGDFTAGLVSINGVEAKINSLGLETLQFQSEGLAGVEFVAGKVAIDTTGSIRIEGNLTVEENVTVGKDLDVAGTIRASDQVRGIGQPVVVGAAKQTVTFEKPHRDNRYAVTVLPNWKTEVWTSSKSAELFTIEFSSPAPEDASIDWIILR